MGGGPVGIVSRSGTLTYDRESSGTFIFFEEINNQAGNCAAEGRIDIKQNSVRSISWEWHEIDGDGPFATAVLKKKSCSVFMRLQQLLGQLCSISTHAM